MSCTHKCYLKRREGKNAPNWKGGPVAIVCEECSITFEVPKYRKDARFCSKNCVDQWKRENTLRGKEHPLYIEREIKYCEYCDKEFEVTTERTKFCSKKCWDKWRSENWKGEKHPNWKPRVECICENCSKVFLHLLGQGSGKYCSYGCYWESLKVTMSESGNPNWKPKIEKVCRFCGKTFFTHKEDTIYCNEECYGKDNCWYQRKLKKCRFCGKEFEVHIGYNGEGFCDRSCYGKWLSQNNRGENHPRWKGGSTDYPPEFNEELRHSVRFRDGCTCQLCGAIEDESEFSFSVHHVDENKQNNELSNLITLCRSCHGKMHSKKNESYLPVLQDLTYAIR